MLAKEWRDARWKLALGVLAFLAVALIAPRPYENILASVERDIRAMRTDMQSPEKYILPGDDEREPEKVREQMRTDLREMQEPGYPVKVAGWEVRGVQGVGNYGVLVPLAGLLGVALVSGEVSRGSILLLLSRPISRNRVLLVKYCVCAACLFVVALVGAVGVILSAYAHGYPSEAVDIGGIAVSAALIWLGSLFVLGVALLASVIFGDVIRTLIATVAALYLILTGPDLARTVVEWFFWTNSDYDTPWQEIEAWQAAFGSWRLSNYWGGISPYLVETSPAQSFLVCLVTAAVPLLIALWLFRRKAY